VARYPLSIEINKIIIKKYSVYVLPSVENEEILVLSVEGVVGL
jgi:hypothetical protein